MFDVDEEEEGGTDRREGSTTRSGCLGCSGSGDAELRAEPDAEDEVSSSSLESEGDADEDEGEPERDEGGAGEGGCACLPLAFEDFGLSVVVLLAMVRERVSGARRQARFARSSSRRTSRSDSAAPSSLNPRRGSLELAGMPKPPLTPTQESRLIRYLDQELLRLSGGFESRHSGPSARLPTLVSFLDAVRRSPATP